MRTAWFALLLTVALPVSVSCQATPRDPVTFHAEVAEMLANLGAVPLPAGDTLLTWRADGPILYHTAGRAGDTLRAGMRRNDPLMGAAEVVWSSGAPSAFHAWWGGQGAPYDLSGTVSGGTLRLAGARDTVLTLPELPWAIADYGMDDLLLPWAELLAPSEPARKVAVFRPYAARWDTLIAQVAESRGVIVLTLTDAAGPRTALAAERGARSFLWVRTSDSSTERRPLEGTQRFVEFERVRTALGKLP